MGEAHCAIAGRAKEKGRGMARSAERAANRRGAWPMMSLKVAENGRLRAGGFGSRSAES